MNKQYKAEIVAIGTELLLGQISNTNAQWISQQLALYGINVYNHSVVGDNLKRVVETFQLAQDRSDIIIVTGGLGPTEDDMTREAFQEISKLKMIEHAPSMRRIENYYKTQSRAMTPNNHRQARIFEKATVLENKDGMAPGMIVEFEEKIWIFLPGVPWEMKGIFTEHVFPYLYKLTGKAEIIKSSILKFIGIGESALEHELSDLIHSQTNPTIAPLATDDGNIIRLTAKAKSDEELENMLNQAKEAVLRRVGEYFVAENDETLQDVIIRLLKEKKFSIAAAESLTGGMFVESLISIAGASDVVRGGIVCYDTQVKTGVLGVPEQVVTDYGTVSEECAILLAISVRQKLNSDIGIGFTGIAGPNELEGKDVGTVYIGLSVEGKEDQAFGFSFSGDRNMIRKRSMNKGLELIFNLLKG